MTEQTQQNPANIKYRLVVDLYRFADDKTPALTWYSKICDTAEKATAEFQSLEASVILRDIPWLTVKIRDIETVNTTLFHYAMEHSTMNHNPEVGSRSNCLFGDRFNTHPSFVQSNGNFIGDLKVNSVKTKTASLSGGPTNKPVRTDNTEWMRAGLLKAKQQAQTLQDNAGGPSEDLHESNVMELGYVRRKRIAELKRAVEALTRVGLAVEVRRVSKTPLAMGNLETVVDTWVANHRIIDPELCKVCMMRDTQIKYMYMGYSGEDQHSFLELLDSSRNEVVNVFQGHLHLFQACPVAVNQADIKYRIVTELNTDPKSGIRRFDMSQLFDTRQEAEAHMEALNNEDRKSLLEINTTLDHRPEPHFIKLQGVSSLFEDSLWLKWRAGKSDWMPKPIALGLPTAVPSELIKKESGALTQDDETDLKELVRLEIEALEIVCDPSLYKSVAQTAIQRNSLSGAPRPSVKVSSDPEERRAQVRAAIESMRETIAKAVSKRDKAVAALANEVVTQGFSLSEDQRQLTVGGLTFESKPCSPSHLEETIYGNTCEGCNLFPVCDQHPATGNTLTSTCSSASRKDGKNIVWIRTA